MRKLLLLLALLFATPALATCPPLYTLWGCAKPVTTATGGTAMELGTRFTSDMPGYITGIKYYKVLGATPNPTVTLWSSTGTVLAQYLALDQTASGWQVQMLTKPVQINVGDVLVVSRHKVAADSYMHDSSLPLATAERLAPPLHAPKRVAGSVANSVYANSSSIVFPTTDAAGDVFYVDVLFQPGYCIGL
jgi:hypothetical protein